MTLKSITVPAAIPDYTIRYVVGCRQRKTTVTLGKHTFVVSSTDLASNWVSKTAQFTTVASIDSLKALVTRFADNNGIDNAGITDSLV